MNNVIKEDEPNLFKFLSETGYDVIWYGKNDVFSAEAFEDVVTETLLDILTEEDMAKINTGHKDSGNPYDIDDPMYYSFRSGLWTIRTEDINELYDLKKDPGELNNVYDLPEYEEIRNHLQEEILNWYIETSDATEWEITHVV